jgi:phosphoserine aminotransferase
VVLNLLSRHTLLNPDLKPEERYMDYVVTGSWSKKASEEAKRLGGGTVNIVADGRNFSSDGKSFDNIPPHNEWKMSNKPAFIYYCENETVDGVQFSHEKSSPSSFPYHLLKQEDFVPIVADYSSSFMSRPIPHIADHALIYAGAQKNIGPSGLTIVIVREDLLVDVDAAAKLGAQPVPILMSYNLLANNKSLYNTPPMFPMYVSQLVLQEIRDKGGLTALEQKNARKQELLYSELEEYASRGLIQIRVQKSARSWMNATFVLIGEGREKDFLSGAEKEGLMQLKGHR